MKSILKLVPLLAIASGTSFADSLPDGSTYLINNQVHQFKPRVCVLRDECWYQGYENNVNIGYYKLNEVNEQGGTVTHTRFNIRPLPGNTGYYNTFLSAKHTNVEIRYPGNETGPGQECTYDDMGRMTRPTHDYLTSNGTYTYENGILTITIDGTSIQWKKADAKRWEIMGPKFIAPNNHATAEGLYTNALGFGYMTDSLGPTGGLDFRQHFTQGDPGNSASAYEGQSYSNTVGSEAATDASVFPAQNNVDKRVGALYSNVGIDGVPRPDKYSQIIYEDHTHGNHARQYYQFTMKTNYYSALPTLIYENHGHIKPITKDPYGAESSYAFNTRRCWTHSDTSKTQGHNYIHFGVWDSSINKIGHMVSVEVARNNNKGVFYPVIKAAYFKSREVQ
ncbi:hypothetical protein [Aliikangiella coralliicola]|uniref:Uncharacterized protein n=1 Tax=Aliikangiella coralliicola TaxID=2592383 RepID=A0A545UC19_9GAMM|nr:hypothetical protein [Aliikangiella coralliicola]TQV87010.1 hypothetical protein FLL46_14480 [Aliikangiella coralliicola]